VKRFWLSWVQPTKDFRPLTDPPAANVLGWWCTGHDADDHATICALVQGDCLETAQASVRESWPEAPARTRAWRIEDEVPPDALPGDRFPLKPWMQERLDPRPVRQ
jgi:hypothetical protein